MRRSRKKPLSDRKRLAYEAVRLSADKAKDKVHLDERSAISKYLSEIGRKGGLKGGRARATKLSAKKRKAIARKAAEARWNKTRS